ncbi:signal peptidase I [Pengzhenrongella frigida]|uniref:Signal peptidase I n=1 Tax=Pengzhenrongella frigida TaxID=1259133 RepID=A0A4Q5N143_9MICO|nr:signal peptidase I [Cellulomonas sp. HLT2-17]
MIEHPESETPRDRTASHEARHAPPQRQRASSWLRETVIILVGALVLSLIIKTFLVQAFFIPSSSMEDTLQVGDRVLVSKLAPGPFDVRRGDIVVFKDPGGWLPATQAAERTALQDALNSGLTFIGLLPQDSGEHLIKRVIGLPGDQVVCCDADGQLTVNGVSIEEPQLKPGSVPSEVPFDIVVPTDSFWVMGDNRQNSRDSRAHLGDPGGGSIPQANVVGVSFARVWPANRMSLLRNPTANFAGVPEPSS